MTTSLIPYPDPNSLQMSEDGALTYYVVSFLMALLGLTTHQAFYSFHLLRIIVPHNRTLAQVLLHTT